MCNKAPAKCHNKRASAVVISGDSILQARENRENIAMRTLLVVPLILVALSAQVRAADPSQEYRVSDGISMQIPPGWVRIPPNVLDEDSRLSQQNVPASVNMTMDAGFQPSTNSTWMEPPYIVVYVRTKRVPEKELKNYKTMNHRLKTAVGKIDPSCSSLDINSLIYEPGPHILWVKMRDPAGFYTIMGMKLTEQGTIVTGLYCDDKEEKKYSPILERMVRGIILPERLEYKEGFAFPVSDKVLTYALIPVVLAIGAWIKSRWKKLISGECDGEVGS